jgi:hypothetical protein
VDIDKINDAKNTPTLLSILITLQMLQYNAGCIARWSATSRVSLPSGECLRQIAPTATMANKFVAKHQTLKKTIFSKLTYGSSKPKVE